MKSKRFDFMKQELYVASSRHRMLMALFAGLLLVAFAGASSGQRSDTRKLPDNYVSDKCTWFPDCDYGDCCSEHDKAYFFGGTRKERREADRRLYECVKGKGRGFVAKMMWVGVRIGGAGFLPTRFRWGFGEDWAKKKPVKNR